MASGARVGASENYGRQNTEIPRPASAEESPLGVLHADGRGLHHPRSGFFPRYWARLLHEITPRTGICGGRSANGWYQFLRFVPTRFSVWPNIQRVATITTTRWLLAPSADRLEEIGRGEIWKGSGKERGARCAASESRETALGQGRQGRPGEKQKTGNRHRTFGSAQERRQGPAEEVMKRRHKIMVVSTCNDRPNTAAHFIEVSPKNPGCGDCRKANRAGKG